MPRCADHRHQRFPQSRRKPPVGGVAASQHTKGEAADCYTPLGARHLLDVLLENKLSFDQAILYGKKNFLHISYRKPSANRMMVLYK